MSWLSLHLLAILVTAAAGLCVIVLLRQRRTPQSAVAWLLTFLFLPYLALPLFLILGFRKRTSRVSKIDFPATGAPGAPRNAFDLLMTRHGVPAACDGHTLTIHDAPTAAKAALARLVGDARNSIDITLYLVADDDDGRWFVDMLTDRVRSGIAVRILIDRLGSLRPPHKALRAFQDAGGKLRFFSPFIHPPAVGHLNLRNHRKMVIADGTAVWSGGRNVGTEYLDDATWSDLSFDLTGPMTGNFAAVFRADWQAAGGRVDAQEVPATTVHAGGLAAQLVPSGPDMASDALHDGIVDAIHRADRRVWIATPYFLPTEQLQEALATAARRGCDVRIFVPARSNHRVADLARGAYLRDLGGAGCRISRFGPGMMHAKACLIDDFGWIGSANFDVRSMLLNFELALVLYDVTRLEAWFGGLIPHCDDTVPHPGLARRIGEGLFRLSAPML